MFDIVSFLGEGHPLVEAIRLRKGNCGLHLDDRGQQLSQVGSEFSYAGSPFNLGYESDLPPEEEGYWRAELYISECSGPDDVVRIAVNDAEGTPIDSATLILLGIHVKVDAGEARCPLEEVQKRFMNKNVALKSKEMGFVRGHLAI